MSDVCCKRNFSWHLTLSDLISRNLVSRWEVLDRFHPCDVLTDVCVRLGEKFVWVYACVEICDSVWELNDGCTILHVGWKSKSECVLERRVQATFSLNTAVAAEEETNVVFRAEIISPSEQTSVLVTVWIFIGRIPFYGVGIRALRPTIRCSISDMGKKYFAFLKQPHRFWSSPCLVFSG